MEAQSELFKEKDLYRAIVVGPTGMGKSQFCNFIQWDKTNSINKVSDSLNSCTQDPFSNIFKRNNNNYEFIDSAGSSDTGDKDIENLKRLVEYLKKKSSIDHILLLLKFGEKVTNDTRDYIKTLGKIFTPAEFYSHLSVIFTKSPIKPSKKEEKTKNQTIEEINKIIRNSFNLTQDEIIPEVNVYFIDTEYDEDENTYDEKSQDTIDLIMEQIKLNVFNFGSIDTTNLDCVGESAKYRLEAQKKQIEQLKEMVEKERLNRINEEKEKKRIQEELEKNKLDDEKRKQKEKELQLLCEQQRQKEREIREMQEYNRRIYEENERRKRFIEEEAKRKGINIEQLDKRIDNCKKARNIGIFGIIGGILLMGGCILLNSINPANIPLSMEAIKAVAFYSSWGGLIITGGSAITSGVSAAVGHSAKKKKEKI